MIQTNRLYGVSLLIAFLLCIYTWTNPGRFRTIDEASIFAVTESLATRGRTDINALAWSQGANHPGERFAAVGSSGDLYAKKGLVAAIASVPWYLLLRGLARMPIHFGLLQGTLLWNGFLTAFTAAFLWLIVLRLGYRDRAGLIVALLFGLCTIAWPYATHFFAEPLSAFSLTCCFYGILCWQQSKERTLLTLGSFGLAGVSAAVAVATALPHALLVAALLIYAIAGKLRTLRNWTPLGDREQVRGVRQRPPEMHNPDQSASAARFLLDVLLFILPILIAFFLLARWNTLHFNSPFGPGYDAATGEGFTALPWRGAWGLLFSPYRGVFWYTPLLIVSLCALPTFRRRHLSEWWLIVSMSLLLVAIDSFWWMWWGGFTWGPRLLVPLIPFWVLLLAPLIERPGNEGNRHESAQAQGSVSSSFWLVILPFALISLLVQGLAVSVNYVNYERELRGIFPTDWNDPLKFGPPAQAIGDLLYSPVIGQWHLLRTGGLALNSNFTWLHGDGDLSGSLVAVGLLALLSLAWLLLAWWRRLRLTQNDPDLPDTFPMIALCGLLPALVIGVWLDVASRDPVYGEEGKSYRAVMEVVCSQVRSGEAVITIAPTAYHIPMNWVNGQCKRAFPFYGYASNSADFPETVKVLERLMQDYNQVWFVTGGLQPGDPDNSVERWLAQNAHKATDDWFDDYRLVQYATPLTLFGVPGVPINIVLSDGKVAITLVSANARATTTAGGILPVKISFQLERPVTDSMRWFVQLLSAEGTAVALLDTAPDDNYTPFQTLPTNQLLTERAALYVPLGLPAGQYRLIAGLYKPETPNQARLVSIDGKDNVLLGTVMVE